MPSSHEGSRGFFSAVEFPFRDESFLYGSQVAWTSAVKCVSITVAIVVLSWLYRCRVKRRRTYPPYVNIGMMEAIRNLTSNNFPNFLLAAARSMSGISETFQIYLPFIGIPAIVGCRCPMLIREILNDSTTTKPRLVYGIFDAFTDGTSTLFTTNGQFWHSRRSGVSSAFSGQQVKRMNAVASKAADEWVDDRLQEISACCNVDGGDNESSEPFDVAREMLKLVLGALTATAFEYPFNDEEKDLFLTELWLVLKEFALRTPANPFRPLFGWLFPERLRAQKASKTLMKLALRTIEVYRERQQKKKTEDGADGPLENTVLDCIMKNATYETDAERAADVFIFMLAGHDTVAYTLAWTLKELALHPDVQQQLYDDLILNAKLDVDNNNIDEAQKSEVLRNVIREGQRLHPVPAGGSLRQLGRDFTTKEGYVLPKGSIVLTSIFMTLLNERIFGEKTCDEFDPSRWENPTKAMNDAFIPFSLGRQNCVGQSLARAELSCILAKLILNFEFTLVEKGSVEYFATLKPSGTMLTVTKRKLKQSLST